MDTSAAAVQRLVDQIETACRSSAALDIQGGGSKRFYGNPPRGALLETGGLSGITCYEPSELYVTALAGTPLAELEAALAASNQWLSFEPPHYGATATVGGMVAAGISGPGRASAGPIRDFLLGVTMMNGMGELLTFGGQVMKNVAGYDVSRVLAGSMGILGVICEVSLKVMPVLAASQTFCLDLDEAGALRLLAACSQKGLPMTASAWSDDRLFIRLGGAKAALRRDSIIPCAIDIEPEQAARWWVDLRDHRHAYFQLSDAELARGECLWRLAVPDNIPPLSLPGTMFLEWGGTQRWYRGAAAAAQIRSAAAAVGGHATLFRGADKSAGAFTAPPSALMQVHRRLKRAFDPVGIFNPGRLYPEL